MAKVYVHYKPLGAFEVLNIEHEFEQVPMVGEYIALEVTAEWLRVGAVVHCPKDSGFDAEVFAILVEASERHRVILDALG